MKQASSKTILLKMNRTVHKVPLYPEDVTVISVYTPNKVLKCMKENLVKLKTDFLFQQLTELDKTPAKV